MVLFHATSVSVLSSSSSRNDMLADELIMIDRTCLFIYIFIFFFFVCVCVCVCVCVYVFVFVFVFVR